MTQTFKEYAKQSIQENLSSVFSSAKEAYEYCVKEGRRVPAAEDIIRKNPTYAYRYAKDVIKGRAPKMEEAIATSADLSYYYAYNVLRGPFPEGVPAMMKTPGIWERYQNFIKDLGL